MKDVPTRSLTMAESKLLDRYIQLVMKLGEAEAVSELGELLALFLKGLDGKKHMEARLSEASGAS